MRIVYFIGLKILEISGIIGLYYLLCLPYFIYVGDFPFWVCGIVVITYIGLASLIVIPLIAVIMWFIRLNWELAGKLSKGE